LHGILPPVEAPVEVTFDSAVAGRNGVKLGLAEYGMWADRRIIDLFGIEHPILLSPMANAGTSELAIAVSEAGGLGALPCGMLAPNEIRRSLEIIQQRTSRPINLNFFCHPTPPYDAARDARWRHRLARFYAELGIDPTANRPPPPIPPFDGDTCTIVETFKPKVVSSGLPAQSLLARVKASGACVISSATTVAEARWLEENGADAVIAQGYEAGGHRAMFLDQEVATQVGALALIPQIADAVRIPVIAAGGIADGRGIAAALVLGASAVQIGTAYLLCPESGFKPIQRETLRRARDDSTALTNVFTGRPARAVANRFARELGFIDTEAPAYPLPSADFAALRMKAEAEGLADFAYVLFGQSAALARDIPAGELTKTLAADALKKLHSASK
jgi:nitronate monooxygenase